MDMAVNRVPRPSIEVLGVELSGGGGYARHQHAEDQTDGNSHGFPHRCESKTLALSVHHQSEVNALGLATFSPSRVQMLGPSVA